MMGQPDWTPEQWEEMRQIVETVKAVEAGVKGKGKTAHAMILEEAPTNVLIMDETTAAIAAAGLPSERMEEALEKANAAVVQLGQDFAAALRSIADVLVAAVDSIWPALKQLVDFLSECKEQEDEDQEKDDHDGAREILIVWIPRRQTIEMLYAQGADHGGPGPARLALIRVTDDGLRRAETGTNEERRPI